MRSGASYVIGLGSIDGFLCLIDQKSVLGGTLKTTNIGIPSAKPLTDAHPTYLSTSSYEHSF